jgi:hypothetical protein
MGEMVLVNRLQPTPAPSRTLKCFRHELAGLNEVAQPRVPNCTIWQTSVRLGPVWSKIRMVLSRDRHFDSSIVFELSASQSVIAKPPSTYFVFRSKMPGKISWYDLIYPTHAILGTNTPAPLREKGDPRMSSSLLGEAQKGIELIRVRYGRQHFGF